MVSGVEFIQNTAAAGGGWPYVPGKLPSPEPTSYALLALQERAPHSCMTEGLDWLRSQVRADGAVILDGDVEPHWSAGLVLFTLVRFDAFRPIQAQTIQWLLEWRGERISADPVSAIDPSLVGWSWNDGTFSWVEPTATTLLALRTAGYGDDPRVEEAERLLRDRVCADGGWNYGNTYVFGQALDAFAPTTAWALLALQATPGVEPVIERALNFLERRVLKTPSTLNLALTIVAFDIFGRSTAKFAELLLERQEEDGSWWNSVHLTALALLALDVFEGGDNVFRL